MKMVLARAKPLAAEVLRRLRHPTRRGVALVAGRVAGAAAAVCAGPDSLHAQHQRPAQSQVREARHRCSRPMARSWPCSSGPTATGSSSPTSPPGWLTALIATEDHRFYQHHGIDFKRTASAALNTFSGRPAGRLDHHAAAGPQPLPRGDRPCADPDAQDQGSHHGPENRAGLHQGRDSGDLPQHRPLSLQRLSASKWRPAPTSTSRPTSSMCWRAPRSSACSRAPATTTRC